MKTVFLSRKILITIFFLATCFPINSNADAIKVGWIGPLTGDAAVLGADAAKAVQMVIDQANGSRTPTELEIQLLLEDDTYVTAKAVNAYSRLVNFEKVKVIFIYTYSALFALADRAAKDGVLLIDPLDCDEDIAKLKDNVVCIAKRTEAMGHTLGLQIAADGYAPPAAIFSESDAFPGKFSAALRGALREKHIEPVMYEGYPASNTDFRDLLLRVKKSGAKSLYIMGYSEMGKIVRQAGEIGLKIPIYSGSIITSPSIREVAGNIEGIKYVEWRAPRSDKFNDFISKFTTLYGHAPALDISTVPSFDAAILLVNAIRSATPATEQTVQKYFYSIKNFQGASGDITVDADGITRSFIPTMRIWKDGKPENLQ
jgi:branched-chain amino acid transport system substrate-binding protein